MLQRPRLAGAPRLANVAAQSAVTFIRILPPLVMRFTVHRHVQVLPLLASTVAMVGKQPCIAPLVSALLRVAAPA